MKKPFANVSLLITTLRLGNQKNKNQQNHKLNNNLNINQNHLCNAHPQEN
jgi:hypothetical protein